MPSKTYEVKLTGENAGLLRKLVESGSAVEKTTSKMSADASHHSGVISKAFGKVGSTAKDTANSIVSNLGVPVVGSLAVAAGASVHLADEFGLAHARLVTALTNTGTSWDAQRGAIDKVVKSGQGLGFNMIDIQGALAQMTTGMGSAHKAIGNIGLAEDVSAFSGHSLAESALAVTKASEGQLRPLKMLGIDLPVAAGGALKTKVAFEHLVTAQDKLKLVTQQIADHQLKGKAAMSAYAAASDKVKAAQQKVNDVSSSGGQILDALGHKLHGQAAAGADTFAGKQKALTAALENTAIQIGQKLEPLLLGLAQWITNTVIPAIEHMVQWIQTNWPKIYAAIAPTIAKIKGYIEGFVSTVQALWQRFGSTILRYALGAWNNIKNLIKGAMGLIMGIVRLFKDLFTGNWSKLWDDVKQIVKGVWELIKGFIGSVVNDIEAILRLAWDTIGNAVKTGWDKTFNFFKDLPGKILGFLLDLPGKLFDFGVHIIQKLIDGAMSMIGNLGSAIGGGIKGALSHIPGASLIGLASGGIVNFPTSGGLAVLHGREAIIPLDNPRRAGEILGQIGGGGTVAPMSAGLGGLSGGGSPVVIVNLNGHFLGANSQLVPEVALAIENQLMRHGQNGAGARWTRRLTSTGPG